MTHVFSVDVEDYFHAEVFAGMIQRAVWESCPSRVEANTRAVLELLAAQNVHATFFVLGWVAERKPALVREIAAAGHEIACHSHWHRLIYQLTPAEFREDTNRAKETIQQALGARVLGYRAPTYSVTRKSLWALEVLVEAGFHYDSSIFPIRHDRYGIAGAPRQPFRVRTPSGTLTEYPITTLRLWKNLPVGGGGYLRLLPSWYTRMGLRRAVRQQVPIISYIHPWEFDPGQPRLPLSLPSRLRHYHNLEKTGSRVRKLLDSYRFTTFRDSALPVTQEIDVSALSKL